ncbi:MAG: hypothetical protein OXE94_13655 [Aestuariivita sp.]|nr:hypothetical protein [Aestuariivita sp.]MCY4202969.1 hypothetical protein [Aestuariivita sp.]
MMAQNSKTASISDTISEGFALSKVAVRLAQPTERPWFDALLNKPHYLGFWRLGGPEIGYVATVKGD